MDIELSTITFTDQDDTVLVSGVDRILNTGIANTLAGNDIIGTNINSLGITNIGFINTGADNDTLIGIDTVNFGYGISNSGTINTHTGKDTIIATGLFYGLSNIDATINTGAGDDTINATGGDSILGGHALYNASGSIIDTGNGDDIITGIVKSNVNSGGSYQPIGIFNTLGSTINTGNGRDIITGIGARGIYNGSTIDTGNGEDSIISEGTFFNSGEVLLGNGNDSIFANRNNSLGLIENYKVIETGNGNDIITSTDVILNYGIINTGNGDDFIIAGFNDFSFPSFQYSIYNVGTINTGRGNDSIIADRGFELGLHSGGSRGNIFLEEGDDYIKGFGSGDFYGGNGNDTLEFPLDSRSQTYYRVGISDTTVTFSNNRGFMITSEFEKLIAGGTIYDFTSLTEGQTIVVG